VGEVVIWTLPATLLPLLFSNNEITRKYHRLMVWSKPPGSQFTGAMHNNLWYSVEFIAVFSNVKMPSADKKKRYGYSVFTHKTILQKVFGHPTTKPIGLFRELVYYYTSEGDTVLDPFLGSGTTAVACKELKRKFIGIEKNPHYCDIARGRVGSIPYPMF